MNKKSVVHGKPVVISATALPAGGQITLQSLVGGKWTTVTSKNVDAKGLAAFTVTPAKKRHLQLPRRGARHRHRGRRTSVTITVKAT